MILAVSADSSGERNSRPRTYSSISNRLSWTYWLTKCRISRAATVASWMLVCLAASVCLAQPELNGLVPRSVGTNTKTMVTAEGKFPQWPVKVWSSRPGLQFEVLEKGKLSVEATTEALPGVYLIRLLGSRGVSKVVPFVVDAIPSLVEKEPNNSPAQANPTELHAVNISGVLAKTRDVDCFQMECQKGQTLYASVKANPLFGTTIDGVLQICNAQGFVLNQNDDKRGVDPMATLVVPEDGRYLVRLFAFPATPNSTVRFAGGADYRYLLTVSTKGAFRLPVPVTEKPTTEPYRALGATEIEDVAATRRELDEKRVLFFVPGRAGFFELSKSDAQASVHWEQDAPLEKGISVPFEYSGSISENRQMDWIPFQTAKGKTIRFHVDARRFGLELDPVVTVFDSNGKQLATKDDNSKSDPDAVLDFTPKADGQHYLRIKDAADGGGPNYLYRVRAEMMRPRFRMTLAQSSYVSDLKKPLEITVSIDRQDGFKLPLDFFVEGLPEGVKFETARSEPKGDSAKTVKIKIDAAQVFQAKCRIGTKLWDRTFYAEHQLSSGHSLNEVWITYVNPPNKK